ncbi:MAG: transcription termination factor NusA [bacterium]|nr:transcription termination factor NusA [bacterium]
MKVDLYDILSQIESEKGIKKQVIVKAIEDAMMSAYKKNYGVNANVKINVNISTGEIKIFSRKKAVEDVKDSLLEISLKEAKEINPEIQPEEEVDIKSEPKDFGRIAAQTAKQVIIQRLREAEKEITYAKFKERVGEIITGTVQRMAKGNIYINLGGAEGVLPIREQISTERYAPGDRIKTFIVDIKITAKRPHIILSRTHPNLVKKVFEQEIPEIYEGLVEIKSVARDPGYRSKIAVTSNDSTIDPVGTCVGVRGIRIHAIMHELNGEKIDVVVYDPDPANFIKNALNPAKPISVILNKEEKQAEVIIPDKQLSLAIGKSGQNVRLSAKLTGWRIDIRGEEESKEERKKEVAEKLEAITKPEKVVEKPKEEVPLILTGIDKATIKKLVEAGYKDLDSILEASVEDLTKIKGIGEVTAEIIKVSAESSSE